VWHESTVSSIEEQQDAFARALLWREDGLPAAVLGPRVGAPMKRFTIYRNNVFASLTACLAARFPVVARLVGAEFFAAMARIFVERYPPSSPALLEYGTEFAKFLCDFEPAQSLPYLADGAHLEWHVAAAYHGADAQPVSGEALACLSSGALDAVFDLHPTCGLVQSGYPIVTIWEANTNDDVVRSIDAASGGEAALIVRPFFDVSVVRLNVGAHAFATALAEGHALQAAADAAFAAHPAFDLNATLETLFRCGAVVGLRASAQAASLRQDPQRANRRTVSCAN
jgi:hypothetical protein